LLVVYSSASCTRNKRRRAPSLCPPPLLAVTSPFGFPHTSVCPVRACACVCVCSRRRRSLDITSSAERGAEQRSRRAAAATSSGRDEQRPRRAPQARRAARSSRAPRLRRAARRTQAPMRRAASRRRAALRKARDEVKSGSPCTWFGVCTFVRVSTPSRLRRHRNQRRSVSSCACDLELVVPAAFVPVKVDEVTSRSKKKKRESQKIFLFFIWFR
jgi:hypothetical protein